MAPESSLSGDDSGYSPQRRQRDPALSLHDRTRRADSPALSHDDYTVAWICALSLELTASRAMFDVVHENLVAQRGDDNAYVLGRMAHHNVVMVALPGAYGKVNAATVSTHLKRTFPNVTTTLMVGIGGGAPGEANMRLGDVVVATRVIEYDLGKAIGDGQFESTAGPKRPSHQRLSAEPWIHYGGIASGDSVNKDAQKRDAISRRLNTVCFEMEAAGMMDNLQCLPIRGICDYSDSHKNKRWQPYAAATAAAYARELLETIHLPRMGSRRSAIRPPQKKTCSWLLDHPTYLDWLDPDKQEYHHGFLWIRGKAGAGKSTLMKFLYSEARKVNDDSSVISYFFNARGEYLERSTIGMYRSLLKHLLVHMSTTEWHQIKYDTYLRSVFESQGQGCPGFNELKQMVRCAVLARENRPLIFFIDALDECDEDDVRDMMCFFEDLAEDASEEGIELHVCFSSRPYPYVSIRTRLLMTLEEEAGHTADLARYVNKRLRIQDQYRAEFESYILDKAWGIFMWVVLVVDILNKESNRGGLALRRRLSEIPLGLSQLFKDILTRDEENPQELRRCILWVLCAQKPLTPDQFRHAMWAAGLRDGRVDNVVPDAYNPRSSNALVISSSKGLAEVSRSDHPVVQFIHESVRDFLVRDRGLQELWPDLGFEWEGPAHESIRECCELYLTTTFRLRGAGPFQDPIFCKGYRATDYIMLYNAPEMTAEERIASSCVFLDYASKEILYHSNLAAPCVPQQAFLARLFGFERQTDIDYGKVVSVPVPRYKHADPFRNKTILETFTLLRLDNLIRLALKAMGLTGTNAQMAELHRKAFFAAIQHNHSHLSLQSIAPLLGLPSLVYEGEAIITTKRITWKFGIDSIRGRTPLSWASQEGQRTLAKVLILNGESLVEKDSQGYTPLQRAILNKHTAIVRLLSESGLDMGTRDVAVTIHQELRSGNFEMTQTLLKVYDGYGKPDGAAWIVSSLLPQAIGAAPRDIVDLLIRHTANDNKTHLRLLYPLRTAIIHGSIRMVAILLDRGVDINARDDWDEFPLLTAVRHNKAIKARMLVERLTARQLAAQLGHDDLVRILDDIDSRQPRTEG
ncbi:hypothetical protein B0T11DRAFT_331412 [Plectosphaerella cucumerina]|uniref:Nucleoside phosphorylase domain-containing protein n=1 Tax=Plectosphaerella cucumerina TaxID=40658 RepID=A0A8K0WZH6_9PEZI|nr:hypothetical protein B0T11DRAFT_331412 [Plectosphaerella cucumerina]